MPPPPIILFNRIFFCSDGLLRKMCVFKKGTILSLKFNYPPNRTIAIAKTTCQRNGYCHRSFNAIPDIKPDVRTANSRKKKLKKWSKTERISVVIAALWNKYLFKIVFPLFRRNSAGKRILLVFYRNVKNVNHVPRTVLYFFLGLTVASTKCWSVEIGTARTWGANHFFFFFYTNRFNRKLDVPRTDFFLLLSPF